MSDLELSVLPAPQGWTAKAACLNRPYEWFALPDSMLPSEEPTVKLDLIKGQGVCLKCPVVDACWTSANEGDRAITVRGGRWPSAISNARRGRPNKGVSMYIPDLPGEPDLCPSGHDKQLTGYYLEGRCWVCRNENRERYKDKKSRERADAKRALMAAQAADWLAREQCDQGHDLGPVEGRTSNSLGYFCGSCKREARAKSMRDLRASKKAA